MRFHQDMLANSPVEARFELLKERNNNAYHHMSTELLEETGIDQIMKEVDILLLAYNFPNIRPDISIVNYLMDRYQARFLSFAVNDLGFGAPFAALHMLQHYLSNGGYKKAYCWSWTKRHFLMKRMKSVRLQVQIQARSWFWISCQEQVFHFWA